MGQMEDLEVRNGKNKQKNQVKWELSLRKQEITVFRFLFHVIQ